MLNHISDEPCSSFRTCFKILQFLFDSFCALIRMIQEIHIFHLNEFQVSPRELHTPFEASFKVNFHQHTRTVWSLYAICSQSITFLQNTKQRGYLSPKQFQYLVLIAYEFKWEEAYTTVNVALRLIPIVLPRWIAFTQYTQSL